MKPVIADRRINNAKLLWIIVACMWIINPLLEIGSWPVIGLWPWVNLFAPVFRLKQVLNVAILVYIALRYPEAVLISKAQISRAVNVYETVISMESDVEIKEFGMSSLVDYLKQVPREILEESGIGKG